MPIIILPRRCLKRISLFSVLMSRKYGNIFISYIGLVLIEIFVLSCRLYLDITRIVYGASVFNLYEQTSGTLFASDSCKTPKILKATFCNAISVFQLSDDIGEFLVYISIPYRSGLPLVKYRRIVDQELLRRTQVKIKQRLQFESDYSKRFTQA